MGLAPALTRHVYNSMVYLMSKRPWDKLTPEQQKIIKEEPKKAGQWMRDEMLKEETGLIDKLKAKGVKVTQPDIAAFRKAMVRPTSASASTPARKTSTSS